MIKGLTGGPGITVSGGNTSVPYVNYNSSNPMQGMMRINGSDMQVFDGTAWININASYASASLDIDTLTLLEWARKKRLEEQEIEILASDHPAVRIAKENLNNAKAEMTRAEQQLKVTIILSNDEQTTS